MTQAPNMLVSLSPPRRNPSLRPNETPTQLSDAKDDHSSLNPRLQRIAEHLACPKCLGALTFRVDAAHCEPCQRNYPIRRGKIYFVSVPPRDDSQDRLKESLKRRLGKYYYTIGVDLLAPTFPVAFGRHVRRFVQPKHHIVVDLGCGNRRIDPHTISLDFSDYDEVDIVCDLTALPFKTGSLDACVSRSALEHVPDITAVADECSRCTKPGGMAIHLIPFMYPFHASPFDFTRLTAQGQRRLFSDWKVVEQRAATGPVTLALISLIECLSILLSLGLPRLRAAAYLASCVLLAPLKFLDWPFVISNKFISLAPTILFVGRKRGTASDKRSDIPQKPFVTPDMQQSARSCRYPIDRREPVAPTSHKEAKRACSESASLVADIGVPISSASSTSVPPPK